MMIRSAAAAIAIILALAACDPHTPDPNSNHLPMPPATSSTPTPTHTTDECTYNPQLEPTFQLCTDQPERPTFAPDANITILALCATDGSPCEAWMKTHRDQPIHTYGTKGKTLNGGVIRFGTTELQDDGFELWGMPGHFEGAVS